MAEAALETAGSRHTSVPGEKTAARMVHTLASQVVALNQRIAEMNRLIAARFRKREHAEILATPDRLAGFGSVAPASVPRDPGKISDNLRRPQHYNRRFQRVLCNPVR
ncbi:hypothetical protein ACFT9I_02295 [Streptomyces sp. NPDC057137]|uniref:hypothetical protein n=1 Tax=Streptomyces sp. NPDC057137 TaxID=3346030 RepID=UPI0036434D39